jgi:exosortase/archaeosortase family protein
MAMKTRLSKLGIFRLGMTPQQEKLWETFLFLIKVLVLSIPLYMIIIFSMSLYPLQALDASVSSGILRVLGYQVLQEGAYLTVGTGNPFSFFLTEDCTAWKSFLFLFALIFAVPKVPLRGRLSGLGLGIPVLWLGNQARIVGVVLTEQATNVQFAMLTHDYFWRIFLVFLVLGVWLAWMRYPHLRHASLKRRSHPRLISRKTKRKV